MHNNNILCVKGGETTGRKTWEMNNQLLDSMISPKERIELHISKVSEKVKDTLKAATTDLKTISSTRSTTSSIPVTHGNWVTRPASSQDRLNHAYFVGLILELICKNRKNWTKISRYMV